MQQYAAHLTDAGVYHRDKTSVILIMFG